MTGVAPEALTAFFAEFDAAFAAGDADRFAACFAEDGRQFLLYREPTEGRTAIREVWRTGFERFDTSAWEARTERVELHGDSAYAFRTYTEKLLARADGARQLVRGRLAYFMGREPDGEWRVRLLLHSHSHPMEPLG